MLTSNLDKISEHGRRADGIVQSMLLHSRGGSGDCPPPPIDRSAADREWPLSASR
jgi:hypothetical protein